MDKSEQSIKLLFKFNGLDFLSYENVKLIVIIRIIVVLVLILLIIHFNDVRGGLNKWRLIVCNHRFSKVLLIDLLDCNLFGLQIFPDNFGHWQHSTEETQSFIMGRRL
jgi:hypothetical protein